MNKQELQEIIREELAARSPTDKDQHADEHRWLREDGKPFVESLIAEAETRIERNKAIKKAVYIWGSVGLLSWIASFIHDKWESIMQLFVSGN